MTPHNEPDLLTAVQELSTQVADLSEHLSVSQDQADRTERQARRSRVLTRWVAVVAVVSMFGVLVAGLLLAKVQDAVDTNEDNARISCQNGNDTREANLSLWTFIIEASLASNTDRTPQQLELIEDLRVWVTQIFAPRDCSQLGKEYEIPPPPSLQPAD